jgi:hypothetical protein
MHKFESKAQQDLAATSSDMKNIPIFELKKKISESRIGGEYYFISNLLNKAALLSLNCEKAIEKALEEISKKKNNFSVQHSDDELR